MLVFGLKAIFVALGLMNVWLWLWMPRPWHKLRGQNCRKLCYIYGKFSELVGD